MCVRGVCGACLIASSVKAVGAAAAITAAGEAAAADGRGGVLAGCHACAIMTV